MSNMSRQLYDNAMGSKRYNTVLSSNKNIAPLDFPIDGVAVKKNFYSYQTAKRYFDITLSFLGMILIFPALACIAISIKLDSKGPIFYRQDRWGKDCKIISVLKFRSMFSEMCDKGEMKQCVEGDSRLTRVGKFMRKYNLDELPQLYNVLKGDMSLVGPRCHAVGMLAVGQPYEKFEPDYHMRHVVRPGITGLAQVRGHRGPTDTKMSARARFTSDMHYVRNISFFLDLKILFLTFKNEFVGGSGF